MQRPEPTKKDKKILRQAIDIGLEKDFLSGILKLEAIIAQWKENKGESRATYHELFKALKDHDKIISRRYDGLTGGRYVNLVCELLGNDSITEKDLAELNAELLAYIKSTQSIWKDVDDKEEE
jgi:hypothetical protein